MKTYEIYFTDLNETAQKSFLEFLGIDNPKEANMDMQILPIATIDIEEIEEKKG